MSPSDLVALPPDHDLGVSGWRPVEQALIDRFAEVTGDAQWIHTDPERAARESPYGAAIAHGYLTLSLLPALRAEAMPALEGVRQAINYGLDRVRFLAPVRAGARVRVRVTLLGAEPKGAGVLVTTRNTVEVEGEARPAMLAEALTLYLTGDATA